MKIATSKELLTKHIRFKKSPFGKPKGLFFCRQLAIFVYNNNNLSIVISIKPQIVKLMETKGMMDKIGPPGRFFFIGKKCQKFIENPGYVKNTVSIVPIIGRKLSSSDWRPVKTALSTPILMQ